MAVKLANFARSVLALGITADDLQISVADATNFPAFGEGDYSFAVLENALYQREIVKITARAGNIFTVVRGQDGTTARVFNSGDVFALRVTATVLDAWITAATAAMDAKITALETTVSELSLLPAGSLVDWPTDVIPTGFLLRDGTVLSRDTYAALFAAIGTRYGVGDGATTFAIPDHLGEFPRYWAAASGRDPDILARTAAGGSEAGLPGSWQGMMYQAHTHSTLVSLVKTDASGQFSSYWPYDPGQSPSSVSTVANGGNETRPRNVYVTPLIKWR